MKIPCILSSGFIDRIFTKKNGPESLRYLIGGIISIYIDKRSSDILVISYRRGVKMSNCDVLAISNVMV